MSGEIRVLHVDDERDFAVTTATHLEREDDRFVVETATDARDALDRLSEDGFDCIVSDHEMPEMSGIEILERVREEHPDIPFILFTGRGSEEVASEAISAGVTDYLRKSGGTDQFTVLANRIIDAVETARAKAAARRSQKRLEGLSGAFPDVAFYVDEDGRYVEVIAGDESPLLYDEAESLVGQRLHEVFPTETAERFYGVVQEALETGDLQKIEYSLDVRAGERWFEARVVPLEKTASDRRMAIWVARDITERKERERELERQNRRLDEFASVVSHDLRNPLTIARGQLELARQECDTEHLDYVARAHDRMERLIDDLLTLSKKGRPVDGEKTVSLRETTEACWRNVETEDATLVVETDRMVRCDKNRLQQLLENLIRNAVEHGPTGGRTASGGEVEGVSTDSRTLPDDSIGGNGGSAPLTVTVGDIKDGGEEGFYVADDGDGVPEEKREEVFESGYTTAEEGTGFGLSIVEEIAGAHDWDIRLTDSEDGGARFEITGVEFAEDRT